MRTIDWDKIPVNTDEEMVAYLDGVDKNGNTVTYNPTDDFEIAQKQLESVLLLLKSKGLTEDNKSVRGLIYDARMSTL